jgi:ATP-binding cassette, subfamily B (MDR/TAP), member 1
LSDDGKYRDEKIPLSDLQPLSIVGNIRLVDVSFAYPTRPAIPVLRNISLDIPAGEITAIVGKSGCGKSIVIALLERWYALQQGRILLDEESMEKYTTSSWRDAIGLVQLVTCTYGLC